MTLNRYDKPMKQMLAKRKSVRGAVEDSVLHARAVVKAFDEVLNAPIPLINRSAISATESERVQARRVRTVEAEIERLASLRAEAELSLGESLRYAGRLRAEASVMPSASTVGLERRFISLETEAAQWQMTIDELRALQQDAHQSLAALKAKLG